MELDNGLATDDGVKQVPGTDDVEIDTGSPTPRAPAPPAYDHWANLALDPKVSANLSSLASELVEEIEQDLETRRPFLDVKAKMIRELGLDRKNDTRTVPYNGASNAVHPMLATCATDMSSRITKEIWGVNGPVACDVFGKATPDKEAQAQRVQDYMNLQLRSLIKGFREQMHIMFKQLPLDGTCFFKTYWDQKEGRPKVLYRQVEDVIVPYYAESLETAERITDRVYLSKREMKRSVRMGLYRDLELSDPAAEETSPAKQASDDVEGKTMPNTDAPGQGRYTVYECHTFLDLGNGDVDPVTQDTELPYVVSIEKESGDILAITRNWWEPEPPQPGQPPQPKRFERCEYFTSFLMEPWRGVYGVGLGHQIGGLSTAATGAMRALLDAAQLNNTTIWGMMDNTGVSGEKITVEPNSIIRFKAKGKPNATIDQVIQRIEFAEPSATLFQLLGFLVESGTGYANVNLSQIADMSPSGTSPTAVLALLDQGMNVFNAMFSRIRESFGRFLKILHRVNYEHLQDSQVVMEIGEQVVSRLDFGCQVDVSPSADTHGGSQTRRIAQAMMLEQMSESPAMAPHLKTREIVGMGLTAAGIDPTTVMTDPPEEPARLDPVANVMRALEGRPVKLFDDQDPDPLLNQIRVAFQDPLVGANPDLTPLVLAKLTPLMLQCIIRRMAKMYGTTVKAMVEHMVASGKLPAAAMSLVKTPQTFFDNPMNPALTDLVTAWVSQKDVSDAFLQSEKLAADAIEPIVASVKKLLPPPQKSALDRAADTEEAESKSKHELGLLGVIKDAEEIQSNERIQENNQAQANLRAWIAAVKDLPPGASLFGHLPSDVPDEVVQLFTQARDLLQTGNIPGAQATDVTPPAPPQDPMPDVPIPPPGVGIAANALHSVPATPGTTP